MVLDRRLTARPSSASRGALESGKCTLVVSLQLLLLDIMAVRRQEALQSLQLICARRFQVIEPTCLGVTALRQDVRELPTEAPDA